MSALDRNLPENSLLPLATRNPLDDDVELRRIVERLFRKRGDSGLMRSLEQVVLEYRLEQRQ